MTQEFRREPRWNANVTLIPALVVIGIGVLFLLGNLGIVIVHDWFDYWPVILIAVGLVKLVDSTFSGGRVAGAIIMGCGAVILADNLGYLHARWEDYWPLVLVAAGLLMLANRVAWFGPWSAGRDSASSASYVSLLAIFGGSNRKVNGGDFQGASLTAIFGGVNLDLRKAAMTADEAVVDVTCLFGGAEIKVPENWTTTLQGAPIFGGFDDRTVQPTPGPGVKRLIVRGVAMFGGVGLKN